MERLRGNRRLQRFRGTTLAEAAIVMSLLCLVTLGALQYGWFFYCLHTATNAARQGARVAATLDGTCPEGEIALNDALGFLVGEAKPPTGVTPASVGGEIAVRGEVFIPKASAVRLLPVDFLPVPDCMAIVVMAKEGAN